jgi:hypothetical protein
VPLKRTNVAGAEVRAWIVIPSQSAWPSGTTAIATGVFPDACIFGNVVCLTVITVVDEAGANKIGRITVGSSNALMQWTLPDVHSYPWTLNTDRQGNIWMANLIGGPLDPNGAGSGIGDIGELLQDSLLSANPFNGYVVPAVPGTTPGRLNPGPTGVAIDNQGNIWYATAYLHPVIGEFQVP